MTLIDANGVQVNVEDTGFPASKPDAPTVVFGHGLLFSGHMFDAQVERLRPSYRCVTIDWRGQGKTPATNDGYDMDTLFHDAAAVIESLGVGPVHYVGLSMGGFVGMRLAARRPELLRSLTLLDTSADPEDLAMAKQDRLLAKIYRVVGIRPLAGKVQQLMFGPTFIASAESKPDIDRWKDGVSAVDRSGMVKSILGVVDRLPVSAELGKIALPTLIVVGEDDVATPVPRSEAIAAGIKGSVLKKVPNCGHSSTVEQPTVLADLIEEFLTAQDKGDSLD
ncbi:MAG: alpha/beta fold hydrolase [Aeromicrobium sp.]